MVSKISENIIPIVVRTAIVENRKKINLKIASTFLLASNLIERFLYVISEKIRDRDIRELKIISLPK